MPGETGKLLSYVDRNGLGNYVMEQAQRICGDPAVLGRLAVLIGDTDYLSRDLASRRN